MTTELLLAPVGAGKTDRALAALVETLRQDPFAKIWVLLPTLRQEDAFRQRLIDYDPGRQIYFNVEFFNFYTLYARLLDMAGQPQRELDNSARLRLLRGILSRLLQDGELELYERIADKPGFVEVVAGFIYELKQNVNSSRRFHGLSGASRKRPRLIYHLCGISGYITEIWAGRPGRRRVVGAGFGGERTVPDHLVRDVALLVVDGFDQFNPLQLQLLTLLASRTSRTLVTLAQVVGREQTVGRRFEEARKQLFAMHDSFGVPVVEISITALDNDTRTPALHYLAENSFLPVSTPRPSDGCLSLIEASDPAQEAAAVLRRVKRLLLTTDCTPDDILIAVRDWPRYARHFASFGHTYKIPLSLHYGEPASENPAVIALLNLLELHDRHFRRRDLLDVLHSPYFDIMGFDDEQVDLLEKVSQSQLVIGGRDEWLTAIEAATKQQPEDEFEQTIIDIEDAAHLTQYLTAFFDAVTPPMMGSIGQYVRWLESLIGSDMPDPDEESTLIEDGSYSLHMFRQVRDDGVHDTTVSRDLSAMQAFKGALRNLLAAQNLFASLDMAGTATQDWTSFVADLKLALSSAAVDREANRAGKVLVTTVTDGRGLPHKHIFIPGLAEGVFPAPAPQNAVYLDSERVALTERGITLETSAERAADEGLFYELICQACETLTLSRPTVQNGALWPESHLWRAVRDLFSDAPVITEANRVKLGGVVPAEDVATVEEAALAAADALSQTDMSDPKFTPALAVYSWLVNQQTAAWNHIRRGREIELGRMGRGAFDHYSGRLHDPQLIKWAADQLGERRVWSASQFNDYGMCGFRFFAKRLLKLEALEEPEDGMDAAQRGTINHAILEETYRRFGRLNEPMYAEHAETAVTILHQVADSVLRDAPTTVGFRASALWEQEKVTLLRKLEKLVRLDFSESSPLVKHFGAEPRQPYRLESPFSTDGQNAITIDLNTGLEPMRVTGYIDRMDRQGDRVIMVDYKTGSHKIPTKEMEAGRNFQMMLYLLAAEQILADDPEKDHPTEVAGGMFWHLQNRETSGEFKWDSEGDRAAIESAAEHLTEQIRRGRAGQFGVQPGQGGHGPCSHYCEFNQLCRVSTINRSKTHV